GFNPYRRRLGDGATVSVVGAMKLDGAPVTMLAAKSENATITLFVRDSDGRVVGSSTKANESEANDGALVDLKFEYFTVPNDLAARSKPNAPQGKKPIKLVPAKPL